MGAFDDYLCMAKSTTVEVMHRFCKAATTLCGPYYLRGPIEAEKTRTMAQNA
jgi:hypothetical protein